MPFDHYAVAEVHHGKVTKVLKESVTLSEVLNVLRLYSGTQEGRQCVRLLQRTAFGFKVVRLAGGIV